MKLGIVISSNDPETVWNAVRFANFSIEKGDRVSIFLLGRGVECEKIDNKQFAVSEQLAKFLQLSGSVMACGTCMKSRNQDPTSVCPLSSMADLHSMVAESDRVLTF